jgi:hypothetical protein
MGDNGTSLRNEKTISQARPAAQPFIAALIGGLTASLVVVRRRFSW